MKVTHAILLVVFLFVSIHLFSQTKTGTVKGKVIDSTTLQNLKSATVSILNTADSSIVRYGQSMEDGSFKLENIPFGDYILLITSVGLQNTTKNFSVSAKKPEYNAGTLYLVRDAKVLGEVVVKTPLVIIKGDTAEFNAGQVKTIPNAMAEDVLKKLPGVEVEKDGTVKSQGQNVTRVLVDGKKFFGDDPKMATKNIPADIIDKIQVIDAQSDQSVFSGFDDGNRVKTINIVTKKNRRKGIFGKASAAMGNNDRYAGAISANRFNGNQQLSFIAQGNNINNQNFTVQDFLGSMNTGGGGGGGGDNRGGGGANVFNGNSSGISTTLAGGVNYNDVWGKKTLANGSYFYNNIKSTNSRDRSRETFVTGDSSLFNISQFISENNNKNQRFNIEIDHRFDSLNSLLIRPSYSYQQTDATSETHSLTTKGKLSPLNEVLSNTTSENHGYNFNNSILFRHQFKKSGRTFSINLTQGMNSNDRRGTNLSYTNNFSRIDTVDQVTSTNRDGKNFGANVSLTERIGLKSQVELTYNYNYTKNNSDQQTYRLDTLTRKYDVVVSNLTNLFENTNISQRAGVNYRIQLNQEWSYSVGMAVQHADLTSNNQTKNSFLNQSFYNLFPAFQFQYRKMRTKNLRFSYRGSTQQPSIMQLQDVIDNSNVLYIRSGNPALKQEFTNNFNLNYNTVNITKFKYLSMSLNSSFVSNKIANTNTVNTTRDTIVVDGYKLGPGVQFSKPQNLNGAFNVSGFINYSLPVTKPKSRISFTGRINYSRDVNLVNSIKTYTNNYVLGDMIRFTMNLKEKLDLNFSSNSTYNIVRYTAQKEQNGDYFTQRFSIEPTWSTKSGWILSNDFDYVMNRGQGAGFNQSVPLWNAGLAKLFLKNKEAELRFSVFDILNQNKSITRNVEQNYIEDVRTEVLNRYFLLSFTYYLRKFNGQQPGRMNNNPRRNNFENRGNNNFNERRMRN
ncbi:MAG TPA: outer membrane beta-barrel protein [Chitinophagaceae bacterium]|jgi:hypothetical protein|nr:outer membrane beta-barrel protein [Chitinophagaceae bacterium]